eukprot:Nitzschia sp. Nitz4//scaffold13_size275219//138823//139554//NITZ4_000875-RA/size275219-processed-gene-0.88-mRNA-1//1//CDS//3329536017//1333//frame0
MTMLRAYSINDEAVLRLFLNDERGVNNREATSMMLRSLGLVKAMISTAETSIHHELSSESEIPVVTDEGRPPEIQFQSLRLSRECFIHKRPLLCNQIFRRYRLYNFATSFSATMIAATIVFNLALMHQQFGCDGDVSAFHKAEQLYEMVLGMTRDYHSGNISPYPCELGLVALNNLTLVYTELGKHSHAKRMEQPIVTLLTRLRRFPNSPSGLSPRFVIEAGEWDQIMLNATMPTSASMAPAA